MQVVSASQDFISGALNKPVCYKEKGVDVISCK